MMTKSKIRLAPAVAAAMVLLAACGSAAKPAAQTSVPSSTPPVSSTTPPSTSAPSTPTPNPTPTTTTAAVGGGGATTVSYAAPVDAEGRQIAGVTVSASVSGTCNAGSDAIGNVPVYRCFSGNGVYDPCWALAGSGSGGSTAVVCQADPWSDTVTRITAPGVHAGGAATAADLDYPWAVSLTDGTHCLAAQGAHDSFEGRTVEYYCPNQLELVGTAVRTGPVWSFPSAQIDGTTHVAGPTVLVGTAWFAGPDPTTLPSCTGGQLVYGTGSGAAGAGHIGAVLLFRNTGSATCTLTGYPGVAGLDSTGAQAVQAERTPSGYLGGLASVTSAPSIIELLPGQTASAVVEGTDVPTGNSTSCPSYPDLLVTAPGTTTSIRVAASLPGCSTLQVHPVVFGTTGSQT